MSHKENLIASGVSEKMAEEMDQEMERAIKFSKKLDKTLEAMIGIPIEKDGFMYRGNANVSKEYVQ